MKMNIMQVSGTLAMAAFATWFSSESVYAQFTVTTVQTNVPAVIGYTAQPRGLFGLRTAYQPIVANVPVQKTVTVRQAPVYVAQPVAVQQAYMPATVAVQQAYVPTTVGVQQAYVPAPVAVQQAYVPAPVTIPVHTYLAPVPPTPIPVTTYYTPVYPTY